MEAGRSTVGMGAPEDEDGTTEQRTGGAARGEVDASSTTMISSASS